MYWTQRDERGAGIVKGGMDGSWLKFLIKGGRLNPTSIALFKNFRVYWVNEMRDRIEHANLKGKGQDSMEYDEFIPRRIAIEDGDMYWVGRSLDGSFDAIFEAELNKQGMPKFGQNSGEFDVSVPGRYEKVSGLWLCDADIKYTRKANVCGWRNPCAGICLLSGSTSFQCVCPIGFNALDTKGRLCSG